MSRAKKFIKNILFKSECSINTEQLENGSNGAMNPNLNANTDIIPIEVDNQNHYRMGDFSCDDIFICGWPKSGNTWVQRIMSCLYWGIDPHMATDQICQTLQPDVHANSYYKRFITPMIFKSHFLPLPEYKRVIHLVRDGRDATLSYWHFLKNEIKDLEISEIFKMEENLFPSSWQNHCREWVKNPYDSEILVVRYEDLLHDPVNTLKKVCDFIGVVRSESTIKYIASNLSIQNLRNLTNKHGWNGSSPLLNNFFRKGISGSHKSEVPCDVIENYNRSAGDMLEKFGYL